MCEFWTLKQSKNHVMMGSIDAWFYKYIAGIQPDDSVLAYASFTIKPLVSYSLNSARAELMTMRGTIASEYERDSAQFSLSAEIPFNTSAKIFLPGKSDDKLLESGKPLKQACGVEYLGYSGNFHILKVNSGNYKFTAIH